MPFLLCNADIHNITEMTTPYMVEFVLQCVPSCGWAQISIYQNSIVSVTVRNGCPFDYKFNGQIK